MDTKTIVGIVLVVAVAGALAFLKIRSRRKSTPWAARFAALYISHQERRFSI